MLRNYSGPTQPIFISAESQNGQVAISVADRGVGIDAMEQSLIFDKFYRARAQRQMASGPAWGFAISRAIVEAHGGTLSVTSQVGQGSVFILTLPTPLIRVELRMPPIARSAVLAQHGLPGRRR